MFPGCAPQAAGISPGSAMLFISFGSLGCRFSLRLDTEWDFPKWKKDSQLPTGDFLALAGGRLQLQHINKPTFNDNCAKPKRHERQNQTSGLKLVLKKQRVCVLISSETCEAALVDHSMYGTVFRESIHTF